MPSVVTRLVLINYLSTRAENRRCPKTLAKTLSYVSGLAVKCKIPARSGKQFPDPRLC